jgi:Peptidase_C39 like family
MIKYLFLLIICLNANAASLVLDVPRIKQETPLWCWLAASEMVLKSQGNCAPDLDPYYQQSMIKYLSLSGILPPNCFNSPSQCVVPAGGIDNFKYVIDYFSKDGAKNENCGKPLKIYGENTASSFSKIVNELKHKKPIIIGISLMRPKYSVNSTPDHAVVVIGYNQKNNTLIINDPFDYELEDNPWNKLKAKELSEGKYEVSYSELKGYWKASIYIKTAKN